jgi:hypothetical protein
MSVYTPLSNVFAWRDGQEWLYVESRVIAPAQAVEVFRFSDGQGDVLTLSEPSHGIFIRNAKLFDPSHKRSAS